MAVWHRRAGKDEVGLYWTARAANLRPGNYWHLLPEAAQARKAIWDSVNPHTGRRRIDEVFPAAMRLSTRDEDMRIRLWNESAWQVVGSDNYDSLVGSSPVGLVFSEYALGDPAAWDYLHPILAENAGWALFIYTPRGKNHGHALLRMAETQPGWFAEVLPASKTGVFPPDVLATERREYEMGELGADLGAAMYAQEYECSFDAAIQGSYYGGLLGKADLEGRIGAYPHDPAALVTTAWDLGYGDDTVVWFAQIVEGETRVIDYYANRGMALDHYAKIVRDKPYNYHAHLLPHDGAKGELIAGSTIVETAKTLLGRGVEVLPRVSVEDGINAARLLLPRCRFDAVRCADGIEALRQYRRDWNDERKAFSDRPRHDWSSHAADAFRYLAMGLKAPPAPRKVGPRQAGGWMAA